MSLLNITTTAKKSHTKVKQLSPRQRREKARRLACCYHCGRTDNLITFKRADGKDVTLCEAAAKMEGLL